MRCFPLFLLLLWMPLLVLAREPAILSRLQIKPTAPATRFIFTLSKKTYGHLKYRSNPDRVLLTFSNTHSAITIPPVTVGGHLVKSMEMVNEKNALLFLFRVNEPVHWNVEFLPGPHGRIRVQLTLFGKTDWVKKIDTCLIQTKPFVMANKPSNKIEKHKSRNKTRPFIVVIDAGHGGKDAGAIGKRGSMEKNIVLAIAKKVAGKINAQKGMRAVLTRHGDYFVPLRKRLHLARGDKADLFIAIHADAYFNNTATGVSVYALSQRGATNEAARWLARQDNYNALDGVDLQKLMDKDPVIRSVLLDLSQTATIEDSIRLGHEVLASMDDISSLHSKRVERAPFVVLKSPDIPSILVETGFITNPKEEHRLNNHNYQDQIAQALMSGIKRYMRKLS